MAIEDYITIPELPEATSLQNTDLFPIRDSLNGIDKKLTYANLKTGIVNLFRDFASIYDNTKSYKINDVVEDITTGILYKSLVNNNLFALTDISKWKKLGSLSLIDDLLTTFNIANKLLKLNSNGLIDNVLLKNQYIYSTGIQGNQNAWYECTYNADGTICKIIQGGRGTIGDNETLNITLPIAFTVAGYNIVASLETDIVNGSNNVATIGSKIINTTTIQIKSEYSIATVYTYNYLCIGK